MAGVSVIVVSGGTYDSYDCPGQSVEDCVLEQRQHWNEGADEDGSDSSGLSVTVLLDGVPQCVMLKLWQEPELCRTAWCDGRIETHRCRYILGTDGMYERTEVTAAVGW
jgi:hypothetical protein